VSVDGGDTVIGSQLCGILLGFTRKKIKFKSIVQMLEGDWTICENFVWGALVGVVAL